MRIYMGADHAGFESKDKLKDFLGEKGYEVVDLGCFSEDPCDYPDLAREVGEKVRESEGTVGILVCGSGIGISMAANKMSGVRCALVYEPQLAEMARKHNHANCLAMGARYTDVEKMKEIVIKFLTTEEDKDDRHKRRVEKINTM